MRAVLGAEIETPGQVMIYGEQLGKESFQKLYIDADGVVESTNCPLSILMHCEAWRVWQLRGANGRDIFIAYDPKAARENPFWRKLREAMHNTRVPALHGELTVFQHGRPVVWDELDLRRELNNFLVRRYRQSDQYTFEGL